LEPLVAARRVEVVLARLPVASGNAPTPPKRTSQRSMSWSSYSARHMAHLASSCVSNKPREYFTFLRPSICCVVALTATESGPMRAMALIKHGKQQHAKGRSTMTTTHGKKSER